jgi:hypothetical protein
MTTLLAVSVFLVYASGLAAGVALGRLLDRRTLRRVVRYRLGL